MFLSKILSTLFYLSKLISFPFFIAKLFSVWFDSQFLLPHLLFLLKCIDSTNILPSSVKMIFANSLTP